MAVLLATMAAELTGAAVVRQQDEPYVPYDERRCAIEVRSKLGLPLGTVVDVVGRFYTRGAWTHWELASFSTGGLEVQRVNGEASQGVFIALQPQLGAVPGSPLVDGCTYEFRGYETVKMPVPPDAAREVEDMYGIDVALVGRVPGTWFAFSSFRDTPPLRLTPADFLLRRARLEGIAKADAGGKPVVEGQGWVLFVEEDLDPWPTHVEGKVVEVDGVVLPTQNPGEFVCRNARVRLVRLVDMLGTEVRIEGVIVEFSEGWWLRYRDTCVLVEFPKEQPAGWRVGLSGRWVIVTGGLEKERRRELESAGREPDTEGGIRGYFVLKHPRWTLPDDAFRTTPSPR